MPSAAAPTVPLSGPHSPGAAKAPARLIGMVRVLAGVAGLAAIYYGLGALALVAAPVNRAVSAAWPPAGLALAALVLFGTRLWPGIWIGAFLVNATAGVPLPGAMGMATGNALGAVVGAWLLRRVSFDPSLSRLRDVGALVALGALASTLVNATIGIGSLAAAGAASPTGALWLTWWTGDTLGVLVTAPLLMVWVRDRSPVERGRLLKGALLMTGLVAFAIPLLSVHVQYAYAVFPFTALVAGYLGARGATLATALLAVLAAREAIGQSGPFAAESVASSLVLMQIFVALLALKGLVLAAGFAERRAAEVALQRRGAQLVEAQRLAGLGSWEWDPRSGMMEWSDELYEIFGIAPGPSAGTFEDCLQRLHPGDRDRFRRAVDTAVRERGTFQLKVRILRPEGSVRLLEATGRTAGGADGALRVTGSCLDITERRRAEEAAREARDRLEAVFDASPLAILEASPTGVLLRWNGGAERMFGWTEQEVVGKLCPTVPAELLPDYLDMIARGAAGKETRGLLRARRRKDGSVIQASINSAPVRDAGGAITGVIIVLENVTERAQAEVQVQESRQRLSELSHRLLTAQESERGAIARRLHDDVGQTLASIKLTLDMMRESARVGEVPGGLDQVIAPLDQVMRSLRDLSHDLHPVLLDDIGLSAALRWHADRQGQRAGFRVRVSAEVNTHLPPDLELGLFRIAQEALTNIARHAWAREVQIGLTHRDGEVTLTITDDGAGFDPADAPRSGGIGLIAMAERAMLLRGSVRVDSAFGRGTTIEARFPLPAAIRTAGGLGRVAS